jgi:hypothetical protein
LKRPPCSCSRRKTISVTGWSSARRAAAFQVPQLVLTVLVPVRLSARPRMRVLAMPRVSKTASSRRSMTVSVVPRMRAGSVVRGTPSKLTSPRKVAEPRQKKPAGMGFELKL